MSATLSPTGSVLVSGTPKGVTRLELLETQLADLRLRGHTDESPDVNGLRSQIDLIRRTEPKEPAFVPAEDSGKTAQTAADLAVESTPEMLQSRARIGSLR